MLVSESGLKFQKIRSLLIEVLAVEVFPCGGVESDLLERAGEIRCAPVLDSESELKFEDKNHGEKKEK